MSETLRIRFAKVGRVRWTSHRDVARMWERAFRRLSLPVAYSGGYAPRPRISFGFALPTGCESVAEYLDVEMAETFDISTLTAQLSPALPVGVDAAAVVRLEPAAPSLQQDVTSSTWLIELPDLTYEAAEQKVDSVLGASTLVIERERKGTVVVDDVRPAVLALDVAATDGTVNVVAELAAQPRGLRPAELAKAMGARFGRVRRLHQWIERDGARREPIPLDATDAPHAWERAS